MRQSRPYGTSARRKRQNAEAQRTYRAKQKERLRVLEQLAVSTLAASSSDSVAVLNRFLQPATQSCDPEIRQPTSADPGASVSSQTISKNVLEFPIFFSFSRDEINKCLRIMVKEGFGLRHVVKYGLISLGYGVETSLFDQALNISSQRRIELVQLTYGRVDMEQVISCGVRLFAQLPNPPVWPSLGTLKAPCPSPPRTISLSVMTIISAQLLNMPLIGMTPDMLWNEDSESLFFKDGRAAWSARSSLDKDRGQYVIPPDLRPTANQFLVRHHPYIDLIPWPTFRANVLAAISQSPPTINEDDLCMDLANDGVRCWGNTGTSLHGRGEGMPWDSRSWEAAPWFLEKWRCLIGGEDDEISRNSAWWRTMQDMP
ncbi:hypothetical protein PFICI_11462 [Pestalotiopsis fici W106-1]|uniref:BZIP domain-containing protein n=1 Tax=Pestalotiopsis fici (strain W106-1 / CGMCC3.15140) TaxID=1229662 RepID=W3WQB6_PESFW|nr:uncharacterized protein PFICI_11462 [Pestalotiopsis fici W106-1]ETS76075.1 hypothetical protein PFICI_11462 [Pestalotiopsis fici W106-1]